MSNVKDKKTGRTKDNTEHSTINQKNNIDENETNNMSNGRKDAFKSRIKKPQGQT